MNFFSCWVEDVGPLVWILWLSSRSILLFWFSKDWELSRLVWECRNLLVFFVLVWTLCLCLFLSVWLFSDPENSWFIPFEKRGLQFFCSGVGFWFDFYFLRVHRLHDLSIFKCFYMDPIKFFPLHASTHLQFNAFLEVYGSKSVNLSLDTEVLGFYNGFKNSFNVAHFNFFFFYSLKIHSAAKLPIVQSSLSLCYNPVTKSVLLRWLGSVFSWCKFYASYHHCQCRRGKMSRTYLLQKSWGKTCVRVFSFSFSFIWLINKETNIFFLFTSIPFLKLNL